MADKSEKTSGEDLRAILDIIAENRRDGLDPWQGLNKDAVKEMLEESAQPGGWGMKLVQTLVHQG
jgi:hypothetical protein